MNPLLAPSQPARADPAGSQQAQWLQTVKAMDEMEHMTKLHGAVVSMIQDYKAKSGDPPKEMQLVYDILHKRHIDNAGAVKAMQMLYKEQ